MPASRTLVRWCCCFCCSSQRLFGKLCLLDVFLNPSCIVVAFRWDCLKLLVLALLSLAQSHTPRWHSPLYCSSCSDWYRARGCFLALITLCPGQIIVSFQPNCAGWLVSVDISDSSIHSSPGKCQWFYWYCSAVSIGVSYWFHPHILYPNLVHLEYYYCWHKPSSLLSMAHNGSGWSFYSCNWLNLDPAAFCSGWTVAPKPSGKRSHPSLSWWLNYCKSCQQGCATVNHDSTVRQKDLNHNDYYASAGKPCSGICCSHLLAWCMMPVSAPGDLPPASQTDLHSVGPGCYSFRSRYSYDGYAFANWHRQGVLFGSSIVSEVGLSAVSHDLGGSGILWRLVVRLYCFYQGLWWQHFCYWKCLIIPLGPLEEYWHLVSSSCSCSLEDSFKRRDHGLDHRQELGLARIGHLPSFFGHFTMDYTHPHWRCSYTGLKDRPSCPRSGRLHLFGLFSSSAMGSQPAWPPSASDTHYFSLRQYHNCLFGLSDWVGRGHHVEVPSHRLFLRECGYQPQRYVMLGSVIPWCYSYNHFEFMGSIDWCIFDFSSSLVTITGPTRPFATCGSWGCSFSFPRIIIIIAGKWPFINALIIHCQWLIINDTQVFLGFIGSIIVLVIVVCSSLRYPCSRDDFWARLWMLVISRSLPRRRSADRCRWVRCLYLWKLRLNWQAAEASACWLYKASYSHRLCAFFGTEKASSFLSEAFAFDALAVPPVDRLFRGQYLDLKSACWHSSIASDNQSYHLLMIQFTTRRCCRCPLWFGWGRCSRFGIAVSFWFGNSALVLLLGLLCSKSLGDWFSHGRFIAPVKRFEQSVHWHGGCLQAASAAAHRALRSWHLAGASSCSKGSRRVMDFWRWHSLEPGVVAVVWLSVLIRWSEVPFEVLY